MLYLQALLLRPAVPLGAFLLCFEAPFRIPAVPLGAFLLCFEAPFCCTSRRFCTRPRRLRIYTQNDQTNNHGRSTAPPNPPNLSGPPVGGPRPGPSRPAGHRPDPEIAAMAGPVPGRSWPHAQTGSAPAEPNRLAGSGLRRFFSDPVLCPTRFGTPPEAGSPHTRSRMSRPVRYLSPATMRLSVEPRRPVLRPSLARLNIMPNRPPCRHVQPYFLASFRFRRTLPAVTSTRCREFGTGSKTGPPRPAAFNLGHPTWFLSNS